MVEWWSVVEWWSGGVVEWWSGGMVEWWSGGEMTSEARYTCDYISQVNCLYLRNANII